MRKSIPLFVVAIIAIATTGALFYLSGGFSSSPLSSAGPRPSSIIFVNATIDNATQITAYVTIRPELPPGINNLTVESVMVDNIPQNLTPALYVLYPNQVQKFVITGTDTNWTDGADHFVYLFVSWGFPAGIYISK